jgi:hypothetical protein
MRQFMSLRKSANSSEWKRRAATRHRPVVEELEPRILYSADFAPALLDAHAALPAAEQRVIDSNGEFAAHSGSTQVLSAHAIRHEVVFVDTAVADYESLVRDVTANSNAERQYEVVLLNPDVDGIKQISQALTGMHDISAIHVISHGADGQLELGGATLNFDSLLKNASQIKGWGQALTPGADLLIYGCDVAEDADGKALVDALSRLTGADVAASENLTGAATKGGDWTLEYRDGSIQSALAISAPERAIWNGILDATASSAQGTAPAQKATQSADAGAATGTPPASTAVSANASPADMQVAVASTPLAFEPNVGQAGSQVDFVARGSGYVVGLAGGDAILALQDGTSSQAVRLQVMGKNAASPVTGEDLLQSKSNYLIGSQDEWRTNVANFGAVRYDNVYDGIDLRYYGNQRQLEYDFVVNPGANVGDIQLKFDGVKGLSIANNGDLVLTLDDAGHTISFKAPVAYQDGASGRETVDCHYTIAADGTVGFEVGSHDPSQQLIIDPVLSYASYFGGNGNDAPTGIAVDPGGNVYITGFTASTNLLGGLLGLGGVGDAFIAKFSPDLSSLVYSTIVGGSGSDQGDAIAVDASGNAYVAGITSSLNFPTVSPLPGQATLQATQEVFVLKLNQAGSALVYSTYLGGLGSSDYSWGIAIDASGSAYVTGTTTSSAFPTTTGAWDTTLSGSSDAFVTKLSSSGNSLVYSTLLGGSGAEIAYGIAVDSTGQAVVAGETSSSSLTTGFPVTGNALQPGYGGGTEDIFVTKLNSSGSGLLYSSYFGGNNTDVAYNVTLDSAGKIYFTGQTSSTSTTFTTTPGSYNRTLSGTTDAFAAVIDPSLSGSASLRYSTYLGGSGNTEAGLGIGVDAGGRIYIGGQTNSSNFPVSQAPGAYQTTNAGKEDAFVVVLNPIGSGTGDLVYGTYFGGKENDYDDNGVYSNGKFYLTGDTTSNAGIATSGAYDTSVSKQDAFVAVFTIPPAVTTTSAPLAYIENAGALVLDAGIAVSDPGVSNLGGATVKISGNYVNGEDVLAFNNANSWGITGTWDAATATLALTGTSSVANYQAALRSVTYKDTSDNPSTATRTVTVAVSDGVLVSAPSTRLISVTAVNDPPTNAVPGTQAINEDTSLLFSSTSGNAITIGDVDAGNGAMQVSLNVTNGVLTLAGTTGLTFVTGSGTANPAMTFTGTIANINAALNGLRFDPTANFNGVATLQVVTNDQGNTGSGGPQTATSAVSLNIAAVNDPPVNSLPGPQSTQVNTALTLSSANGNAISLGDIDAGTGNLQVTLTAPNGVLALSTVTGLASVSGQGTGSVAFTGSLASLNAALNGLTFTPASGFAGATTLSIVTNDQGNTGLGGALSTANTLVITVSGDIAPTVTCTGSALSYVENAPATPVDPGLTVTDPDSPMLDHAVVKIASNYVNGEDVLGFTNQLGITGSWDAATGTLMLTGSASPAAYQTALRSVTYQNLSDDPSTGPRAVTFVANDSIADGAAASRTIAITAVNDPPFNVLPTAQTTNEDTPLVFSLANGNEIKIGDVDAGGNSVQVTLNASNGSLTLAQISGLTFSAGVNGGNTMTFTGSIGDINAALNGLSFAPGADYNGPATVQVVTNDLGNSGTAPTVPGVAMGTVAVTVAPVNDPPTNSVPGAQSTGMNAPITFGGANAISVSDVDANGAAEQIQLTVGNGTLALGSTSGLTFIAGANGSATMTFAGTLTDLDNALSGLTYTPNLNYSGADVLGVVTNDLGNTGSGGPQTATSTVGITVQANQPPTLAATALDPTFQEAPGLGTVAAAVNVFGAANASTVEAGQTVIGLTFTVDGLLDGTNEQLLLDGSTISLGAVSSGTTANNGVGYSVTLTGSTTATVTLSSGAGMSAANAAALVDGVAYQNANTDNPSAGTRVFTLTEIQDSGGIANGGADTSAASIASTVNVVAVNDAPANTVPGLQTTAINTPITFSGANAIAVSDADDNGATEQIQLTVGNGTLMLGSVSGLTFVAGTNGSATMTFAGTLANLNAALNGLTYTPSSNYVGADALSITSSDLGNSGSGGPLSATDTVAIAVTYSAPTLATSAGVATYIEKSPGVPVDAGLTLNQGTLGNLTGAAVQISGNYVGGEDVLTFTPQAGITGSWDPVSGTLTLSGTSSVASYESALRSVTYQDTSNDPSTALRNVAFAITDGVTAQSAARQISVTAVNDPPTLSATGKNPTFTEGGAAVPLFDSAAASTVEAGQYFASLQLTVKNLANGSAEQLSVDGTVVDLIAGNSLSTAANNYSVLVTVAGSIATVTITPAANTMTAAGMQNLVDGLAYQNTSQSPGTAARIVTLTSVQDNGGTGSGSQDTSALSIASVVTVVAVDNAPVNTVPGSQSTGLNSPLVFSAGGGNSISVSDVDAQGATEQVTLSVAHGTLTLGGTAGLTFSAGTGAGDATMTFAGALANLNAALDGLTYTPSSNYFGMDALNIASDDLGNSGAGGPLGASDTVAIAVSYSAPGVSTSASAANYTEKNPATPVDAGLVLNQGTVGNLTGATVQISGNYVSGEDVLAFAPQAGITGSWDPVSGTLNFTGTASVASYQSVLRSVTYRDTSADPSTATRDVTFAVTDGLTTQSGAQQINVISVNDAPALAGPGTYSATERTALNLAGAGITVADVDGDSGVETLTLSVVSGVINAGAGTTGVTVINSGTASVTLSGSIAQLSSLLTGSNGATLTYMNASYNPPASDALTLTINDNGSGGPLSPLSPLTATRNATINIAAVDDSPVNSVPGAQSTSYNTPLVFSAGGGNAISVSDVDGNAGVEQITLSVAHGKLTLSGTAGLTLVSGANGSASMTYKGTLTNLNAALNALTYTPANNYSGADTLKVDTNDLGNTGSGGQLIASSSVGISTALPPPVVPPTPPAPAPSPSPSPSPPSPAPPAAPPPSGSPSPMPGPSGGTTPPGGGIPAPVEPAAPEIPTDVTAANDRNAGVLLTDGRMRGADFVKVQSTGPAWAMPATASSPGLSLAIGAGLEKEATLPTMGAETLTISSTDPEFTRAPDMVKLAAYRSTLGNKAWVSELDHLREAATGEPSVEHRIVGSTVAVTGAMSVGYVIWLLRGGLLLSSLLSSLPAWHAIDPMPVLARAGNSEDDGEEDDPLETLFGKAKAAIGLGRPRTEPEAEQTPSAPAPTKTPQLEEATA